MAIYSHSQRNASGRQPQRIEDVCKHAFLVASLSGVYIHRRKSDGTYCTCMKKITSRVFISAVTLAISIQVVYLSIIRQWGFYVFIMALPYWYNTIFAISFYFHMSWYNSLWNVYLPQLNMLKVTANASSNVKIIWIMTYTITVTILTMFMMPVQWYVFIGPSVCVGLVPSIVDIYIGSFVYAYGGGYQNLAHRMTSFTIPTLRDINNLTEEWFYLKDTLSVHNQACMNSCYLFIIHYY